VAFNPEKILAKENMLKAVSPQSERFSEVIHVAETSGLQLFSDIVTQRVLCI